MEARQAYCSVDGGWQGGKLRASRRVDGIGLRERRATWKCCSHCVSFHARVPTYSKLRLSRKGITLKKGKPVVPARFDRQAEKGGIESITGAEAEANPSFGDHSRPWTSRIPAQPSSQMPVWLVSLGAAACSSGVTLQLVAPVPMRSPAFPHTPLKRNGRSRE